MSNRAGLNVGLPKFNFRLDFLKDRINPANYTVPRRYLKWAPLSLIPLGFYVLDQQENTQMDKLQRVTEDLSRREAEYANQMYMHWKAEAKLGKLQEIAEKQRELERQLVQSTDSNSLWGRKKSGRSKIAPRVGDKL